MNETSIKPMSEMTPAQMVSRYSKVLALKKKIDDEYKQLRAELLEVTKESGVVSLKTEDYTLTRQSRTTVKVTNHKAAISALEDREVPVTTKVVLDDDYMKPIYKKMLEEGEVIPGIDSFTTEFVTIRMKK